jgi:hypothetical protein
MVVVECMAISLLLGWGERPAGELMVLVFSSIYYIQWVVKVHATISLLPYDWSIVEHVSATLELLLHLGY